MVNDEKVLKKSRVTTLLTTAERQVPIEELVVCDCSLSYSDVGTKPISPYSDGYCDANRVLRLYLCNPSVYPYCNGYGWGLPDISLASHIDCEKWVCAELVLFLNENTIAVINPEWDKKKGFSKSRKQVHKDKSHLCSIYQLNRYDYTLKCWITCAIATPIYLGVPVASVITSTLDVVADVHYLEKTRYRARSGDIAFALPPMSQATRFIDPDTKLPLHPYGKTPMSAGVEPV